MACETSCVLDPSHFHVLPYSKDFHSCCSLSYDRSVASSKVNSPQNAFQCSIVQSPVSSLCFLRFSKRLHSCCSLSHFQSELFIECVPVLNHSISSILYLFLKVLFPIVKDRLSKRLQTCLNLSTVVTGHGKLRSHLHRFKIIEDLSCPCKLNSQTTDHLIWECASLSKQRQILKHSIIKAGRRWPISNIDSNKTPN